MLNKYIWNQYWKLNKEKFEKPVHNFFENGNNNSLRDLLIELHNNFTTDKRISKYIKKEIKDALNEVQNISIDFIPVDLDQLDEDKLNDYLDQYTMWNFGDIYDPPYLLDNITYYSFYMTKYSSGSLVPWLLQNQFHLYERICEEFNIETPDIPLQREKEDRWNYYSKICLALWDFRVSNDLSIPELWAFLFDSRDSLLPFLRLSSRKGLRADAITPIQALIRRFLSTFQSLFA